MEKESIVDMLKISGASDDIIDLKGIVNDEVNGDGANIIVGKPDASEGEDAFGVRVKMRYAKGGIWAATIEPLGDDVKCPWPITVSIENYSAVVTIDCPEGTEVTYKKVTIKGR